MGVITEARLLKWLTKTILVLGLITFSGCVSEFRSYASTTTWTELNEVRRIRSTRTASLNEVSHGFNYSISRTDNFISYRCHQDNSITVKLKIYFQVRTTNQRVGFLIFYSTNSSEEFDNNLLRG